MPRGRYPLEYFQSPVISKPIREIYELIDAYTGEFFEDEPSLHRHIDFIVALPPVSYDGSFTKGICFSQAMDLILGRFPVLRDLFVCAAYSMWSSHPWSILADAYLVCYDNPSRASWFRDVHPERAHIHHIPLQDADYTNEYIMAPVPVLERDIDLLCVSRLHSLKNLPMIATALAVYRKKYPLEPIRMTLIAGKPGAYSREQMSPVEWDQYTQLEAILGHVTDYIDFVEHARHFKELPNYYARSRAFVLGSLIEGKNRCLNEAQSCNTPVICFEELNRYARGDTPSFPSGAGLTSSYDAESLADTIHEVLRNEGDFRPRASYLSRSGRKRFLAQCLDIVPYFRGAVPDFVEGGCWTNAWLDLGVQDNYGVSLHDFVYGRINSISHAKGVDQIGGVAAYYAEKLAM